MSTVAESTVQEFLDALAAEESTPGGGGAAALVGSNAAALVSMVCRFTIGRKKYAEVEDAMRTYLAQSEALRKELLEMIDKDAEAFGAVAACYSMPRSTPEEKAARSAAMQKALKGAAEAPMIVAQKCLDVLGLAEPVGAQGNSNVVSDAAVGAYLAASALRSALLNVKINLKFIKDEPFVQEWQAKVEALQAEADRAEAAARTACTQTLGVDV